MEKEKVFGYIKEHKEVFSVFGLLILCFLLYFFAIGNYPLLDPYETKFVSVARAMFKTGELFALNLNGDFFFQAPPLYFWLESAAFSVFGKTSETIARIPVALYATAGVFLVYIFCRKIVARKNAIAASMILATSLMYTLLSKIAVADMLFSVCIGISIYSGIYTLLCTEEHKKYFWWLSYILSGFTLYFTRCMRLLRSLIFRPEKDKSLEQMFDLDCKIPRSMCCGYILHSFKFCASFCAVEIILMAFSVNFSNKICSLSFYLIILHKNKNVVIRL